MPVALSTGVFGAFPRPPHPSLALIPAPRGTWSGVPGSRSMPLPAGPKVRAECGPSPPRTPELPIPVLLPHSVRARPRPPARSGDDLRLPVRGPRAGPCRSALVSRQLAHQGCASLSQGSPSAVCRPPPLREGFHMEGESARGCHPSELLPDRSGCPHSALGGQSRGLLAAGALSLESRFRWVSCTRTPPCHLGMSPIR